MEGALTVLYGINSMPSMQLPGSKMHNDDVCYLENKSAGFSLCDSRTSLEFSS